MQIICIINVCLWCQNKLYKVPDICWDVTLFLIRVSCKKFQILSKLSSVTNIEFILIILIILVIFILQQILDWLSPRDRVQRRGCQVNNSNEMLAGVKLLLRKEREHQLWKKQWSLFTIYSYHFFFLNRIN